MGPTGLKVCTVLSFSLPTSSWDGDFRPCPPITGCDELPTRVEWTAPHSISAGCGTYFIWFLFIDDEYFQDIPMDDISNQKAYVSPETLARAGTSCPFVHPMGNWLRVLGLSPRSKFHIPTLSACPGLALHRGDILQPGVVQLWDLGLLSCPGL